VSSTATTAFFCHGAAAVAGGAAPDLRHSAAILGTESFASIVRDGALLANGMPRFEELTAAQLEDLRTYLRSRARELRRD
jgi:quinohemoprotein ethanol dehydrogenase